MVIWEGRNIFKIAVNHGAIAQHQIFKEVAKPAAREILREKSAPAIASIDKDEREFVKNAHYKFPQEAIKNAKLYKKDYERTLPETLKVESQNQMWVRAKQLKDQFTVGMLSRSESHPVKGFMDNGTMKWVVDEEKLRAMRSVEREAAWQKQNELKIREFKNIMRHLNPDDPNAGDTERYRPKGGVR